MKTLLFLACTVALIAAIWLLDQAAGTDWGILFAVGFVLALVWLDAYAKNGRGIR